MSAGGGGRGGQRRGVRELAPAAASTPPCRFGPSDQSVSQPPLAVQAAIATALVQPLSASGTKMMTSPEGSEMAATMMKEMQDVMT